MAGRCFFIYTKEKAPLKSEALFHGEGEKMKKSNFRIAKSVNNGDNIIYKPCDEGNDRGLSLATSKLYHAVKRIAIENR